MVERILRAAGRVRLAVLTAGVLLLSLAVSGWAQAPRLITAAVNSKQLTTLAGNTRPEAISLNDRGRVADSLLMDHMMLQLRRSAEQEQALAQWIEQQHDPASPNFHHWLTAQEFGQRYGLSQQDLTTITDWLKSQGFTVNRVYPSGVLIDFSGTAGQVRTAFHTEIHSLSVRGARHISNMSDPQIPAALAPAIVGIVSMNDFRPRTMHHSRSNLVSGGSQLVAPADLATIYNLTPLFSQGITGSGQTVAVIEDTNMSNAADWSTFRSTFGLSGYPGTFTTIHPSCGDPGVLKTDEGEAALDAEWASAAAPGAAIQLVSCANTTTFGGLIAIQNLVNGHSPPSIMSLSYGECEVSMGASYNAAFSSAYQQAVTEGVSVFVAAGDAGASGCDASNAMLGIGISGFASTPYNVAVGGTDFGDTYAGSTNTYWSSSNTPTFGSALSYVPEIPWNDSCASTLLSLSHGFSVPYGSTGYCNSVGAPHTTVAGSGGPSGCATGSFSTPGVVSGSCAGYAKPSWQAGFAGIVNDNVRDIPDVSLFAANGTWHHYFVYCDSNASSCSGAPSTWAGGGGTSFSSPIMAGIQALINQKAGGAQGNPNTVYYNLAAGEYGSGGNASCNSTSGNSASGSCIFYDVTLGDMDVNCTGSRNCYIPSGTTGVLSTSSSSYSPAFASTTGWDFATGIGTINALNLVNNWPGSGSITYTISGQITLSGGGALNGVTVTLSGSSSSSTSTNSSGNYSFTGLAAGGNYTVTPSRSGYGFNPPSQIFGNLQTNPTANFTASSANLVTIQTVPGGLQFSVDGGLPLTAPQTLSLTSGTHTIAVATQGDGAGTQDVFVSWSDNGAASHQITVSGSATYTATFQVQYQLSISAAPAIGGSVTPSSGTFYNSGSIIPVSATANSGYVFANWSGNVANSGNPSTSVTMNAPQTVTANFTNQPAVTIQTVPSGLLFSVDGGQAMFAPQTVSLPLGQHTIAVVTTQNPGAGTQDIFDHWSDNGAASHTINVSGPATYTATFQSQYQLTVAASPPAGGSVTPNNNIFYNSGTVVPVSATANSGFVFTSWSGNVANSGTAGTTVTMSGPQTVTATFTQVPAVTIQTTPPGLQFNIDGGPLQTAPQTVNLPVGQHTIAVPASQSSGPGSQYVFNTWSDNGAASHTINVTAPATYTASFQAQYQLTISASPAAAGTVTPNSGIFYNAGTVVAVSATAINGYNFSSWTGSVTSPNSASTTVSMSAPQTVTANFSLIPTLTVQTVPSGLQFTLDGGAPQTAPQSIVVTAGSHTIAVASSQSGGPGTEYIFNSWNDNNSATSRSVTVNGPVTYTASYQTQYQLTINATPAAGGTVTPNSNIFYNAGTVVPITATANSGYTFGGWSGNAASPSLASTTVTMNAPQTLTAGFALPNCTFSLGSTSVSLPAAGTSSGGFYPSTPQSFTLNGGAACSGVSWTAATADVSPSAATPSMFVALTSASNGTGPGTISFNAFSNTHQAARSATITITPAGLPPLTFTVNEAGSAQSVLFRETDALYQRSLGREPDTSGFTFWTCTTPATVNPCSNLGVNGLGQMVDLFLQSPEGMNSDFQVLAIYQGFLGRLPSFAEWFNAVAPFRINDTPTGWNAAAAALINTLVNSSEYINHYGAPANTNSVITNLYQNLLHRAPTGGELTAGSGTVSGSGLFGLFTGLFTGAEFRNTGAFASTSATTDHSNSMFVTMIYFAVLARDPDAGGYNFWVGVANSGGAGIYFQPLGSTGANMRFQVEGPGVSGQGLVGSPEFQNLFAN